MRRTWFLGVMLLIATSLSNVSAAAIQVAPSLAGSATRAVDANALKPAECADLDLSAEVTTGTGTDANELILGSGSGETLHGGGGDDCIVAGAGDDVLDGGPGSDVCIGGPGLDTYDPSCEVQLEAPPGVPDPPTALDASATSSTSIDLTWTDNADNEDGFAIERSPAGSGSWAQIATPGLNATNHTDTGLTAGAAYDYRVRAFNTEAYSTYSNVATASTVSCATPGTTTVHADADTYVYEAEPTPNAGTDTSLYVMSSAGANIRTLVGFPLPVIPAGCEITLATLRLESTFAMPDRTLEARRVAGSWTETGATWDNQPATTGVAAATSSALGWRAWSVTEQVRAMYTGANHGFLIRDSAEGAASAQLQAFTSREGASQSDEGTTGNAPELVVTFGEPPPPPEPPAAPSGLAATAASGSRIDLSWTDNATDEDGFTLQRSPAGQDTWTEIATTGADVTTHADADLTTNTAYDYRVRAFNTGGTSAWSDTASATTGSCASPGTTIRTDRDTFVYEGAPTFNAGAETFVAVRSASGTNARALVGFPLPALPGGCSLSGATLRLNASQAASGRTLTVQRAAAAWTETGVAWSTQPGPTGTTATTTSGLGWVAWDVRAHVTAMYSGANHGFVIRDATEGAGTAQDQIFSSREGSATLAAELVLTYGEPPEPPTAPSELSATAVSGSRIDLSWTDNASDEDGFTLQRSPAGQNTWTDIATTGADVTTHADTDVSTNASYDYRVRAFNTGGTSAWSNTASATTGSCASPGTTIKTDRDTTIFEGAPTFNLGSGTSLSVQSASGANRRALVGFPVPVLPEGCSLTAATLRLNASQAASGRTLTVQRATAAWTETGVTWSTQPAPTGTTATTTSGLGWVAWDVRAHVTAMYRGTNDGFVIRDATEGAGTAQTQVFVSREGSATLAAELVLTYGELPEPPAAPSGLSATGVSSSRIDLSWTDNATSEDGFIIERSPAGQDTWAEIATADAGVTTHADTGLTASTTYDYRVRAFNTGGTSTWSNTASATTLAGCASPGTQTVIADRDVFVAQEAPTTNLHQFFPESLTVQSRDGSRNARALVGFSLPAVPTGCNVTGATLRLNAGSAATGRTLLAHQAAATWTETGVTWNTQPATTGTAAATTSGTGWRAWAVTTQVNAMYNGANHGFVIRDSAESASSAQTQTFSSREGTNPPQLVITFG